MKLKVIMVFVIISIIFLGCTSINSNTMEQNSIEDKDVASLTVHKVEQTTKPMLASDTEWIEAYYSYMKQSDDDAAVEVLLVDLNFDNTPEILFCYYADGSYYYNNGLMYKNEQIIPFGNFRFSQLIGTIKDTESQTLWYSRYFPFAPHRVDNTSQTMSSINFSDLSNITENQLLEIAFYAPDSFIGNKDFTVKVSQQGENVPVTEAQRSMYQTWYESDAEGGEDIYNLPHLDKLETDLNIQQQKTKVIDISDCYEKVSQADTLNLDKFKQKLLQWYQ